MSGEAKVKCSDQVWSGWRHHPCPNTAKVERDGAWFCGQHDPEAKQARRAKKGAEWERKNRIRQAEWAITKARDAAADLIERGNVTKAEFAAAQDAIRHARKALENAHHGLP